MQEPTYRVAIIGTGGIANHHAGYYAKHPRTTIVAAADIRPDALAAFCEKHNVPARYTDYRELLEKEQPDLVSVCTWTATHPEVTIAAAEAGVRGILSEKPMSAHLGDARRMVAVCQSRGIPLAIHHQRRFEPGLVEARKRIAAGQIGVPIAGNFRTVGGFLNNGTHGVDFHRYLLGDPAPEWVMTQLERRTNRYERGVLVEDRILSSIRFENGYTLTIEVDMDEKPAPHWWVFGTEGTIRFGQGGTVLFARGEPEPLAAESGPGPLDELIAWIEGGPESRNAGHIALVAHEIMMASYESARTRSRVRVPLDAGVERSPLYTMHEEGLLPVSGPAYDIRSLDALRYAFEREGVPLTGEEYLEGQGNWSGQGLAGQVRK